MFRGFSLPIKIAPQETSREGTTLERPRAELVFKNELFAVYDKVLPLLDFDHVWRYALADSYEFVHAKGWEKVWRLNDGVPLWGPTVHFNHKKFVRERNRVYPTQTAIDKVVRVVLDLAKESEDLVGVQGREWTSLSARTFVYPLGTGISWHEDAGAYSGAFTFYAHPEWNIAWGGELLITPCLFRKTPSNPAYARDIHTKLQNQVVLEKGIGHYVMAKPNRLVILRGGQIHQTNKVHPSAGDHARYSVSGFFYKKRQEKKAEEAAP